MDLKTAQDMMDKAFEHIDKKEYDEAVKIGETLNDEKYSGGVEIMATALFEKGEIDGAISVLKNGVRQFKNVWLLWDLLGVYLSYAQKYGEASDAFNAALGCDNADAAQVKYNMAVVSLKEEKYGETLKRCDEINAAGFSVMATILKAAVLCDTGKYDEAITTATDCLKKTPLTDDYLDAISDLYSYIAIAHLEGAKNETLAIENCKHSLEFRRGNQAALSVVRRVRNMKSPENRHFEVTIKGRWDNPIVEGDSRIPEFYSKYQVVAPDQTRCLELIKDMEPAGIRDSITICDITAGEKRPEMLEGVYEISGYIFSA